MRTMNFTLCLCDALEQIELELEFQLHTYGLSLLLLLSVHDDYDDGGRGRGRGQIELTGFCTSFQKQPLSEACAHIATYVRTHMQPSMTLKSVKLLVC